MARSLTIRPWAPILLGGACRRAGWLERSRSSHPTARAGGDSSGDWRSAYVVYHVEERYVELRRVEYDINLAQQKIVDSGLPPRLASRLAEGR